jgi:hypothetical protein
MPRYIALKSCFIVVSESDVAFDVLGLLSEIKRE